jgi:hypothetical protein
MAGNLFDIFSNQAGRSPTSRRSSSVGDRALEGVVSDASGRWPDDDSEIFRSASGS